MKKKLHQKKIHPKITPKIFTRQEKKCGIPLKSRPSCFHILLLYTLCVYDASKNMAVTQYLLLRSKIDETAMTPKK